MIYYKLKYDFKIKSERNFVIKKTNSLGDGVHRKKI